MSEAVVIIEFIGILLAALAICLTLYFGIKNIRKDQRDHIADMKNAAVKKAQTESEWKNRISNAIEELQKAEKRRDEDDEKKERRDEKRNNLLNIYIGRLDKLLVFLASGKTPTAEEMKLTGLLKDD